jgi:hypothetical protein
MQPTARAIVSALRLMPDVRRTKNEEPRITLLSGCSRYLSNIAASRRFGEAASSMRGQSDHFDVGLAASRSLDQRRGQVLTSSAVMESARGPSATPRTASGVVGVPITWAFASKAVALSHGGAVLGASRNGRARSTWAGRFRRRCHHAFDGSVIRQVGLVSKAWRSSTA